MTTPYSPATATAIANGTTDSGYAEYSGVPWDPAVASHNLAETERRNVQLATYMRTALANLRRDLRPPSATVRIMCVGDSITQGVGSTDGAGYRPWLTDLLDQQHIAAELTVVAEGGQTLRHMAPLALAALPTAKPDIVLVTLGTNDAVQPDLGDWQNRYGQFVDQVLASSPTVKVACARIALSREQWMATAEAQVNAAVAAVVAARQAGGRVVTADMTVVSQRWTADGVHPLDAGYVLMAQQWVAAIAPWLPAT